MIKVIAEYKFICNGVKGIRVILKQDGKLIEINKEEAIKLFKKIKGR